MPIYFDKNNLTPEQESRWSDTVVKYERIWEINLDRKISSMTNGDKQQYMNEFNLLDDNQIRQNMKERCISEGAGDPESALFARLLNGKKILDTPPPTSFAYPWHEVIEKEGPFPVILGGPVAATSPVGRTGDADEASGITINQCVWTVTSLNGAARRLFDLQQSRMEISGEKSSDNGAPIWREDFLEAVIAAYNDGPEITVRYGNWPEYRLVLRRTTAEIQRDSLEKTTNGLSIERRTLLSSQDVVDASLYLNAKVESVLHKAQDPSAVLKHEEEMAKQTPSINLFVEELKKSIEADIALYNERPEAMDVVEISYDDWHLIKIESE